MGTILAAIDSSSHADPVLDWALADAEREGKSLTVFTVCVTPYDVGGVSSHPDPEAMSKARQMAEHRVDELSVRRGRKPGVPVKVLVDYGSPADRILERGREVDHIVMGAHGAGALSRLVLGSVTANVVKHATCPVTVIRPPRLPAAEAAEDVEVRV